MLFDVLGGKTRKLPKLYLLWITWTGRVQKIGLWLTLKTFSENKSSTGKRHHGSTKKDFFLFRLLCFDKLKMRKQTTIKLNYEAYGLINNYLAHILTDY